MSESSKLRQLANAIDELELLKGFLYEIPENEVRVTWHSASSCPGYKEMAAGISSIVAEGIAVFRAEAIKRAEQEVARCRDVVAGAEAS